MGNGDGFICDIQNEEFLTFMAGSIHPSGIQMNQGFQEFDFVQGFQACTTATDDGDDIVVLTVKLFEQLTEGFGFGKGLSLFGEVDMGACGLYAFLKVFIGDAGFSIDQSDLRTLVLIQ